MKVTDPVMVRSLLREDVALYLAPFLHEDHSVTEAADLLHLSVSKVHYWVRTLYDAGVLEVVSEVARKGRPIKRYRAIATEFVIPAELLPEGYFARGMRRSNAEMIEALSASVPEWVLAGDFRISATSPRRGSRARVLRDGHGGPPTSHQSDLGLRITAEQAGELVQEISALVDRWAERSDDESKLPPYQLSIALAPIPD